MDFSREKAWSVLTEHVGDMALRKHCVAVEIAMRAYAEKFGEDPEYWGAVGLLHDIDFDKFPDEHPRHAAELLAPYGYDRQFADDIMAHSPDWASERTRLQKTLVAVDPLTGFILACALVRPDKSLDNLELKSILKKMKDNSFSRAIKREWIIDSAQALGVGLEEHMEFVRTALAEAVKTPLYRAARLVG